MKANSDEVTATTVREDLDQLRADLKSVMDAVGKLNSDASAVAREKAARAASDIGRKAEEIYEDLKSEGERASRLLVNAVNEHPYSSLAIALAVGIVIGRSWDRR